MSRNLLAFGGVVLVGALLWMVTAWPAPEEDDDTPEAVEEPPPPPAAPAPPAAPEPEPPAEPAPPPAAALPPAVPEAPPPPEQPQEQPPPPAPDVPADMFREDLGPVAELKRAYESEPRDSAAGVAESTVRAAFAHPDGAPDLFRSVLCRQTVCKIDLRWAPDRMGAYVAGMTRASVDFAPELGVTAAGPAVADGTRPISVYLRRKAPSAEDKAPSAEEQR